MALPGRYSLPSTETLIERIKKVLKDREERLINKVLNGGYVGAKVAQRESKDSVRGAIREAVRDAVRVAYE